MSAAWSGASGERTWTRELSAFLHCVTWKSGTTICFGGWVVEVIFTVRRALQDHIRHKYYVYADDSLQSFFSKVIDG